MSDPSSHDGNHSLRMWCAGFVVAAVQAVTGDKKPVTDPFLEHGPEKCEAVFRKDHAQTTT
jgi:hypothetical protein